LKRIVARLEKANLFPVAAFELEFFLLKAEKDWAFNRPELIDTRGGVSHQRMYSLDALAEQSGFFEDVRCAGEAQSLPVDTIVKEAAPGQFEINLNHRNDPLRAADDAVLLRRTILECARKNGLKATFMAKPFIDQPGNGMHVHTSLLNQDGNNVFSGTGGRRKLENAVAGLANTMAQASMLFIGSYNGFRRMQPGSYAPTRANWGENNRSVALRIPASGENARRIEHRISGADANPYLVMAAILQGMLEGIEQDATPADAETGNSYGNAGRELPASMAHSLELLKDSTFVERALGKEMLDIVVALKRAELEAFAREITPLEQTTYL
jgi:glutamine synthetase